jgi:hypothetical protein
MKTYYNPEGDPCWIDEEVEIVAWDRDKYFTFKDSLGELHTGKGWMFSFKWSNKLYELPCGYLDEVVQVTRKDAVKELKELRKSKALYRAYTSTLDSKGSDRKEFKSLQKALNFCKSNPDCTFLHACFYYKNGSCSTPVLEQQDGQWYYFGEGRNKRISYKTLNDFCVEK